MMTHHCWQSRPTNAIKKFPLDNLWIRLKGHGLPAHNPALQCKGAHNELPTFTHAFSKLGSKQKIYCYQLPMSRKVASCVWQETTISMWELHQPFEEHLSNLIQDAWTLKCDHKSSNRVIPKVTLSLGLLSPPIPSFSGIYRANIF